MQPYTCSLAHVCVRHCMRQKLMGATCGGVLVPLVCTVLMCLEETPMTRFAWKKS